MKILFADFSIAKYGGIVSYVSDMLKAFRDLGHTVDIVKLSFAGITPESYNKRVKAYETGEYEKKIQFNSQYRGNEKDEVTGYWKNTYYGFFLPPSNDIGVYEPNAVERWNELVGDADIILWNFLPTKNNNWINNNKTGKPFDYWWKFFDLPSRIKQIFLVHDAYFNERTGQVAELKEKILFLGCAHIAAYQCCSEIGIPRTLLLNPRYFPEDAKMPIRMKNKRGVDFFAAHMFKSMKHMEDIISAVPYMCDEEEYDVRIAGTGIEYNYMIAGEKIKPRYICNRKNDPDLPKELDGKVSIWNRAEEYGMRYMGQMTGAAVRETLQNTKFAIDASWCKHYAQYCRTHINGFIIEAMMSGAYPVLRDYRGLIKSGEEVYDPIFDSIKAIIIPYDATPKQFGDILKEAVNMSPKKYLQDTLSNFALVKSLFNARKNAEEIIRLCRDGRKLVRKELECGKDSDAVKASAEDVMGWFGIDLPIEWETE